MQAYMITYLGDNIFRFTNIRTRQVEHELLWAGWQQVPSLKDAARLGLVGLCSFYPDGQVLIGEVLDWSDYN